MRIEPIRPLGPCVRMTELPPRSPLISRSLIWPATVKSRLNASALGRKLLSRPVVIRSPLMSSRMTTLFTLLAKLTTLGARSGAVARTWNPRISFRLRWPRTSMSSMMPVSVRPAISGVAWVVPR